MKASLPVKNSLIHSLISFPYLSIFRDDCMKSCDNESKAFLKSINKISAFVLEVLQ